MTPRLRYRVRIAICLLASLGTVAHAQTTALENRLKAAIVSKLPQFVEWPPESFNGGLTLDICVAPPDPFGPNLEDMIAGETLNDRQVAVRKVERETDLPGCQVLFLPTRAGAGRHPFLRIAATLPVLTVGDDPRFLDDGGIVRLRVIDGRVRFDIDAGAASRVGLRISSQLLGLAVTVKRSAP